MDGRYWVVWVVFLIGHFTLWLLFLFQLLIQWRARREHVKAKALERYRSHTKPEPQEPRLSNTNTLAAPNASSWGAANTTTTASTPRSTIPQSNSGDILLAPDASSSELPLPPVPVQDDRRNGSIVNEITLELPPQTPVPPDEVPSEDTYPQTTPTISRNVTQDRFVTPTSSTRSIAVVRNLTATTPDFNRSDTPDLMRTPTFEAPPNSTSTFRSEAGSINEDSALYVGQSVMRASTGNAADKPVNAIAAPRVGTLQRVVHPMAFIAQSLQLILMVDPFDVFGIYSWRGNLIVFNIVNAIIICLCAFTLHDFLRLRYATLVTSMPKWISRLMLVTAVAFSAQIIFCSILIRLILGMVNWVSIINYLSLMLCEIIILFSFNLNVIALHNLIATLEENLYSRGQEASNGQETKKPSCCVASFSLKRFLGLAPADPENTSAKQKMFTSVLVSMQRFAVATSFAVFLCLLIQIFILSSMVPKYSEVADRNDPEDVMSAVGDIGTIILEYVVFLIFYIFTRFPINYLWVPFRGAESSKLSGKLSRRPNSSNPR